MAQIDKNTSVQELRQRLAEFGARNRAHFEKNQVKKSFLGYSTRRKIQQFEELCIASPECTTHTLDASDDGRTSTTKSSFESPRKDRAHHASMLVPPPKIARFRDFSEKDSFQDGSFRILSLQETKESKSEQPFPSCWQAQPSKDSASWNNLLWTERSSWSDGGLDLSSSDDEDVVHRSHYYETQSLGAVGRRKKGIRHRLMNRLRKGDSKSKPVATRSHLSKLLCRSQKTKSTDNIEKKSEARLNLTSFEDRSGPGGTMNVSKSTCTSSPFPSSKAIPSKIADDGFGIVCNYSQEPTNHNVDISKKQCVGHDEESDTEPDSFLNSVFPDAVTGSLVDIFDEECRRYHAPTNIIPGETFETKSSSPLFRGSETNNESRSNAVSAIVDTFGGRKTSMSAVERRKAELERKWAEDRVPKAETKSLWQVCRKTGTYKKKVVLHYH